MIIFLLFFKNIDQYNRNLNLYLIFEPVNFCFQLLNFGIVTLTQKPFSNFEKPMLFQRKQIVKNLIYFIIDNKCIHFWSRRHQNSLSADFPGSMCSLHVNVHLSRNVRNLVGYSVEEGQNKSLILLFTTSFFAIIRYA